MVWCEVMIGTAIQITALTAEGLQDIGILFHSSPFPLLFPWADVQAVTLISSMPRSMHSAKYNVLAGEGP